MCGEHVCVGVFQGYVRVRMTARLCVCARNFVLVSVACFSDEFRARPVSYTHLTLPTKA